MEIPKSEKLMTTLFEHTTPKTKLMIYVMVNGEPKPILFYDKEGAYSQSMGRGGIRNPIEIESRTIKFTDAENASRIESLSSFINWSKSAKVEVLAFLKENEITFNDFKVIKVMHSKPIEEEVDIDFSLFVDNGFF